MFDPTVKGAWTKIGQDIGRKSSEAVKAGEIEARKEAMPFMKLWVEADFLDEKKIARDAIKEQIQLNKVDPASAIKIDKKLTRDMILTAREKVNENVNQIVEYLEGLTDEPPASIMGSTKLSDEQKLEWIEGLEYIKTRLGSFETTAKQLAQENGISLEDAKEILNNDISGASGILPKNTGLVSRYLHLSTSTFSSTGSDSLRNSQARA